MASRCNCSRERDGRYARDQCGTRAELGDEPKPLAKNADRGGCPECSEQPPSNIGSRNCKRRKHQCRAHAQHKLTASQLRLRQPMRPMRTRHTSSPGTRYQSTKTAFTAAIFGDCAFEG